MTKKPKIKSKRKVNLSRNKLRRFGTVAVCLCMCLLVVIGLTQAKNAVKISQIKCSTPQGECRDDIESKLSSYKGALLYDSILKIKKDMDSHPYVLSYSLVPMFPPGILVNIKQSSPRYAISSQESTNIALVDSDGRILEYVNGTQIPLLRSYTLRGAVGQSVDSKSYESAQILKLLNEQYKVETASLDNSGFEFEIDGVKVIFPEDGDTQYLLGSLELVLSRLKQADINSTIDTSKSFTELDLRFGNPVLR